MAHFDSQNDSFLSLRTTHSGNTQNDSKMSHFYNCSNHAIFSGEKLVPRGSLPNRMRCPYSLTNPYLIPYGMASQQLQLAAQKRPMRASVKECNGSSVWFEFSVLMSSFRSDPFVQMQFSPTRSDSFRFIPIHPDSFRFAPIHSDSLRFTPIHSYSIRFVPIRSDSLRFLPIRFDSF